MEESNFGPIELVLLISLAIVAGLLIWQFVKRSVAPNKVDSPIQEISPTTGKKSKLSSPKDMHTPPVPDLQSETRSSPRIFISYRRDDSADIAGRIYDRLVQHFQMEHVFKDVDSIPLGVDFLHHLEEAVAKCNFFLLIIGPEWIHGGKADTKNLLRNSTDFVRIEAESALKQGIPVIPLFVRKAIMPLAEDLPESLKPLVYRNGISIRPDPDFHNDLDRLIKAIETHPRQKTGI